MAPTGTVSSTSQELNRSVTPGSVIKIIRKYIGFRKILYSPPVASRSDLWAASIWNAAIKFAVKPTATSAIPKASSVPYDSVIRKKGCVK